MAPTSTIPIDITALAKTLAPLVAQQVTDSLRSTLLQHNEQILAKLDKLIEVTSNLTNILSTNLNFSSDQYSPLYSTVVRAVHTDAAILQEKSKRCVFIGIPHEQTAEETAKSDMAMVAEAIRSSQSSNLVSALESNSIAARRHPTYNVSPGRTRPLKVSFPSQDLRDEFIRHVRSNKPLKMRNLPHSYVRRDYTDQELNYDRQLRQQAGRQNAAAGQLNFVQMDRRIMRFT